MNPDSNPNLALSSATDDWNDLEKEYVQLEEDHKSYCEILSQLSVSQNKCLSHISHHRYRIKCIAENLAKVSSKSGLPEEDLKQLADLKHKIAEKKLAFREMEENLPHKNGLYLSIILGQVNVSLLTKAAKFIYKKDYETFKLTVSSIIMVLAFFALFLIQSRWGDAALNFLCVWYYCTLTIRESILTVNGSRIKGWWLTHHFISTVCSGVNLIWPDGYTYKEFRFQLILFVMYISFVYVLQYYYQSGCLYRLRSLGQSHEMDITVEGFMSWMWKGLGFLLPFLFFGYFFQMYNAYKLIQLSFHPQCVEWQVPVLGLIHLVLCMGNIWTTVGVVLAKVRPAEGFEIPNSRTKYRFVVNNLLSQAQGQGQNQSQSQGDKKSE